MFSVRGQSLLTQTRCALPQQHHLTRPTLYPIIPGRLPVPREPHLTGPEAIRVFPCHSDGSQIPEMSSPHLSSHPAINPLASLCHQSFQETPFSKLHSTSYTFCLRSSQGTDVWHMCLSVPACLFQCCVCTCMIIYMRLCTYVYAHVSVPACVHVHVCVCLCVSVCVIFANIYYTRSTL